MSYQRLIIIVPSDSDALPENRRYWNNFVQHVQAHLRLSFPDDDDVAIHVVEPPSQPQEK